MPYEPFLIAGFKTGKSIGVDPWLSPSDAFELLENMHVTKEVLEKRNGFSPYATMKHGATPQTATTITGIFPFLKKGFPKLIVCDTLRANLYYAFDGTMTDIAGSDIFSGSDSDFFHFANWRELLYMTNNKNQLYKFDGSNLTEFNIPIDTDATENQIDTCRFIFIKDDRMILLDPVRLQNLVIHFVGRRATSFVL